MIREQNQNPGDMGFISSSGSVFSNALYLSFPICETVNFLPQIVSVRFNFICVCKGFQALEYTVLCRGRCYFKTFLMELDQLWPLLGYCPAMGIGFVPPIHTDMIIRD